MRKVRAAGKDYYKVLGVPRDCDASALKKAYRKVREPPPPPPAHLPDHRTLHGLRELH